MMAKRFRDTVPVSIVRNVFRLHRVLYEQGAKIASQHGLQASEMDVVHTLGNTAGMRMGELAARSLTSPPNATRITRNLESRGLVTRTRAVDSDRVVIVCLTKSGDALFEASYQDSYDAVRRLFDELLTKKQQAQLIALMKKMTDD